MNNKNIICFATLHTFSNRERQHHIMEYFSENNNKIIWINPVGNINHKFSDMIRKVASRFRGRKEFKEEKNVPLENENLKSEDIFIIPIHKYRFFRVINSILVKHQIRKLEEKYFGKSADLLWTYYPSDIINDFMIYHKKYSNSKIVYDNVQRLRGVSGLPYYVLEFEKELSKISDYIFCDSITIMNDFMNDGINNIARIPQGVNLADFELTNKDKDSKKYKEISNEFKESKNKIVGYIGGIHHSIDLELIKYLALENPNFSFALVGKVDIDVNVLKNIGNVKMFGYRNYEDLKYYINFFDVCIIPYKVNEFTKGVYPTKMLEYVASRKKIVSVDLPDIHDFDDYIYICKSYDEFSKAIASDSSKKISDTVVSKNSWEQRFKTIDEKLGEIFNEN